jgi:hypothetical protein
MRDLNKAKNILPTDFNDPFYKKSIYSFSVTCAINPVAGVWEAVGNVQVADNNTYGGQNFQGKTFDEVVEKIKVFVDQLR